MFKNQTHHRLRSAAGVRVVSGLAVSCVAAMGTTAGAASLGSGVVNDCTAGSCFDQYVCRLNECNNRFNNDHPDDDEYLNREAWIVCTDGALDQRGSCRDGDPENIRLALWAEFISNIETCIEEFGDEGDNPNPTLLSICIQGALEDYRQLIDLYDGQPDSCGGQPVPRREHGKMFMGPIATLQSAAVQAGHADGKFPVAANSTAGVTAGQGIGPAVGGGAGLEYDASEILCVKSAVAFVAYRTKEGTKVEPIDADRDTSDGTSLDVMFFADKLVDTDEVMLITVFFDELGRPVFGEYGWFEIEESPIAGDWNRDGVADTNDLAAYLESHAAQMSRADLDGDESLSNDDVWLFVQTYVE